MEKESAKKFVLLSGQHNPEAKEVAYIRSHMLSVITLCYNNCAYCAFHGESKPTVPYVTIKKHKEARQRNVRDVIFVSGERPNKFNDIRAILDLWGFESYADYLYTLCELGFLEGVLPTLEVGFLSPYEMKRIRDIVLSLKIMIDSADPKLAQTHHKHSPGKRFELRLKTLEFAGKLRIPVSTGIMVGIDERRESRVDAMKAVLALHRQYDHIQEFIIQPFVPGKGTTLEKKAPPSLQDIQWTLRKALEIFPADVPIVIPYFGSDQKLAQLVKDGLRDIGRVCDDLNTGLASPKITELDKTLKKGAYQLVEVLPIRQKYLRKGWYSGKLSQLLDTFRIRLKKDDTERSEGRRRGPRAKRELEPVLA